MYAETVRKTLIARVPTILLAFMLASDRAEAGQELVNEASCHALGNARFVENCLHKAKDGTRMPNVMDTLSCIARTKNRKRNVSTSAVRAGFVIGDRDGVAGQFLLSVIRDTETPIPAHSLACQLLKYVANPEIEGAMFQTFKDTWPSDHSVAYFEVFRAMRNLEFLAWVDEQLALDTQVSVPRIMLVLEAELIRVQQDRKQILQYITSPEHPILYRTWLALHALRCGLTRADLRHAFLSMVQEMDPTRRERGDHLQIFEPLDELQVFGEQDRAALQPLRDRRLQFHIWPTESVTPWVEEIIATKRAAFLRVPEALGSGQ